MFRYFTTLLFFLFICSCKQFSDVDGSEEEFTDYRKEIAENVEMLYSDSAVVKFRIVSPRMEKFLKDGVLIEEFPKGLKIDFFGPELKLISSISALYAQRVSEEGTLLLKDSVVIINAEGDRLETNSILWDELNHKLSTNKFVRLIKASNQDTLFGFGFEAQSDFSRFELQQFAGKRLYEKIGPSGTPDHQ